MTLCRQIVSLMLSCACWERVVHYTSFQMLSSHHVVSAQSWRSHEHQFVPDRVAETSPRHERQVVNISIIITHKCTNTMVIKTNDCGGCKNIHISATVRMTNRCDCSGFKVDLPWSLIICVKITWWRHQMVIFSALLALCVGNTPVTGQFPSQRPVTRSFDIFFDLRLNKRLSKQSRGSWFETQSYSLWRHCNNGLGERLAIIRMASYGENIWLLLSIIGNYVSYQRITLYDSSNFNQAIDQKHYAI